MKEEKEITVLVLTSYETLHDILTKNSFKIKEIYNIYDTYMINKCCNITSLNTLDILNKSILIRNIKGLDKKLIYKYKKYDKNKDILYQSKVECKVDCIKDAKNFMEALNYKEIFKIDNKSIIYENYFMEIAVQLVNSKYIFIELENRTGKNEKFNSIDLMIKEIDNLNLPILKNNYFVKKAELVFNDIYKNNNIKKYLHQKVTVLVDRPFLSLHPKHKFMYLLNYGYIENTISGDGEAIDAYILGVDVAIKSFTWEVIAIIHRLNDDDDKLIVVKEGVNYTDDEIRKLTNFQEKYFESVIWR